VFKHPLFPQFIFSYKCILVAGDEIGPFDNFCVFLVSVFYLDIICRSLVFTLSCFDCAVSKPIRKICSRAT
jgi:hypothetical protein